MTVKRQMLWMTNSVVFSSAPDDITPPINTPKVKEAMLDTVVPPEGVLALLSWIKLTKAPDADDITSCFLQELSKEITPALKLIFCTSLDSEELPKIGYMHVCHKYTKVAIRTEAPQKVTALYHSLAFAAKRLSTLCIAILWSTSTNTKWLFMHSMVSEKNNHVNPNSSSR